MKMSDLTPEVAEFAKRLKRTYVGGWHGPKEAQRTYSLTLDDKDEVVAHQYLYTKRAGYHAEWGQGKLSYTIAGEDKKEYKDLKEFLTVLAQRHSLKSV